jgi:hypothetical protein
MLRLALVTEKSNSLTVLRRLITICLRKESAGLGSLRQHFWGPRVVSINHPLAGQLMAGTQ